MEDVHFSQIQKMGHYEQLPPRLKEMREMLRMNRQKSQTNKNAGF